MLNKIGFENLPNVYFSKIRVKRDRDNFKVALFLLTYDDPENSHWFSSQEIRNRVRVRLRFFNESGEQLGNVKYINNFKPNKTISFVKEFKSSQSTSGLFVTANLELNLTDLGFDISWLGEEQWFRGPESKEIIYKNNSVAPEEMIRFLKGDSVYYGPVHQHESQTMEGSFHSRTPHEKLTTSYQQNTKTTYFSLDINTPATARNNLDAFMAAKEIVSNVEDGYTQTIVALSSNLLSTKTDVGRLLASRNLNFFKSLSNKIIPKSITAWSDGDYNNRIVYILNEEETQTGGNYRIKNLKLSLDGDVDFFEIRDYSQQSIENNVKAISYKIDFLDNLEEKIEKLLLECEDELSKLDVSMEMMSRFYDKDSLSLSQGGFIKINEMFGIDPKNKVVKNNEQALGAYWITIPFLYKQLKNYLTPRGTYDEEQIFSLLNPMSSDLESMSLVRDYMYKMMSRIRKDYNIKMPQVTNSNSAAGSHKVISFSFKGGSINYKKPTKKYVYDLDESFITSHKDYSPDSLEDNIPSIEGFSSTQYADLFSFRGVKKTITWPTEQEVVYDQDTIEDGIESSNKDTVDSLGSDENSFVPIFSNILAFNLYSNKNTSDTNVKEYVGDSSYFAIPDSSDLLTNISNLETMDQQEVTSFSLATKWNGLPLVKLKPPSSINFGLFPSLIGNFFNNLEALENNEQTNSTNANDYLANSFFNLVKIEYFDGFSKNEYGLYDLGSPVYKTLTTEKFNNLPANSSLITVKTFIDFLSLFFNSQGLQIEDNQIVNKIKIIKRT